MPSVSTLGRPSRAPTRTDSEACTEAPAYRHRDCVTVHRMLPFAHDFDEKNQS
jgi:hypothetical protein